MTDTRTRIDELLKAMREDHDAHGTSVRCPVCNAGIGKFCRDDSGKTIIHAARIVAAQSR